MSYPPPQQPGFNLSSVGQPQPGYPQPGYPQPGYPQPGYPQPGYPQPGAPPPGYPHPQPGFVAPETQVYPQPGLVQQLVTVFVFFCCLKYQL